MTFRTAAIVTLSLFSATLALAPASAMRTSGEKQRAGDIDARAQRHGSPVRHAARTEEAPKVQGSQSGLIKAFKALEDGEKSRGLVDELRRKIEKHDSETGAALRAFKKADFETYQCEVVAAYGALGSKVARQIAAELSQKHPNSLKKGKASAAPAPTNPALVTPASRPTQPRRAASPLPRAASPLRAPEASRPVTSALPVAAPVAPRAASPAPDLRRIAAPTRLEETAPRSATVRDVFVLVLSGGNLPVDPLLDLLDGAQPATQIPAFWTDTAYKNSVVYSKPVTSERGDSYTLYALMPGENKIIDLLPLQRGMGLGGQMVLQSVVGMMSPNPKFMELFLLQDGLPKMLTFAQGSSFEARQTHAGTSASAGAAVMMDFGQTIRSTAEALQSQVWMNIPLAATPARMKPSHNFSATPYREARDARRALIEERKAARALQAK